METKKYNLLMKKRINKSITKWIIPMFYIGTFIAVLKLIYGTNFVPNISLCNSYPNLPCKLPVIRIALNAFSLQFAAFILLWGSVALTAYFIFDRLGFKETNRVYKETKADKEKWDRYGIYAAVAFLPFFILFLIFYAD